MKTLIIANGELHLSSQLTIAAKESDLVIAADGGSKHCATLGRSPHFVIGDMDSIPESLLDKFQQDGVEIVKYPTRKDATDLELAMDLAEDQRATEIHLSGLLGGRWDMSLSNIFLLAQEKYQHIPTTLYGDRCIMHILPPGKHHFSPKPETSTSIIPLSGDAHGVTLNGFEYPLNNYTIPFGSTIGLSNITKDPQVEVKLKDGILLFILSTNC